MGRRLGGKGIYVFLFCTFVQLLKDMSKANIEWLWRYLRRPNNFPFIYSVINVTFMVNNIHNLSWIINKQIICLIGSQHTFQGRFGSTENSLSWKWQGKRWRYNECPCYLSYFAYSEFWILRKLILLENPSERNNSLRIEIYIFIFYFLCIVGRWINADVPFIFMIYYLARELPAPIKFAWIEARFQP